MKHIPIYLLGMSLFTLWGACHNPRTDSPALPEDDPGQDIPEAVWQSFRQRFPAAENPSWDSMDTLYICGFYQGDDQKEAYFNPAGIWLETLTYVQPEDMPPAVRLSLENRFPDNAPDLILLSDKQGDSTYQVDLQTGEGYFSLTLSPEGAVLGEIQDTLSNTEIQEMIDDEDQ